MGSESRPFHEQKDPLKFWAKLIGNSGTAFARFRGTQPLFGVKTTCPETARKQYCRTSSRMLRNAA